MDMKTQMTRQQQDNRTTEYKHDFIRRYSGYIYIYGATSMDVTADRLDVLIMYSAMYSETS